MFTTKNKKVSNSENMQKVLYWSNLEAIKKMSILQRNPFRKKWFPKFLDRTKQFKKHQTTSVLGGTISQSLISLNGKRSTTVMSNITSTRTVARWTKCRCKEQTSIGYITLRRDLTMTKYSKKYGKPSVPDSWHLILIRMRILGSVRLTNGSVCGCGSVPKS